MAGGRWVLQDMLHSKEMFRVGLGRNWDSQLTVKHMPDHVSSIVYIREPTSCRQHAVREEHDVLSRFAIKKVSGVNWVINNSV